MTDEYTRGFLRDELERDRRHERRLILKALLAIAVVSVLLVVRAVYFL